MSDYWYASHENLTTLARWRGYLAQMGLSPRSSTEKEPDD